MPSEAESLRHALWAKAQQVLPASVVAWLRARQPPRPAASTSLSEDQQAAVTQYVQAARHILERGWLSDVRSALQAKGVELLRVHYYSPVPTQTEIEASWERRDGGRPYLEASLYDNAFMLEFLQERLAPFADGFDPPRAPVLGQNGFYWENPMFSYSDALAYYCLIRHYRPRRIIEVGSGYSSWVAAQALKDNGSGELILVEPYPAKYLEGVARTELVSKPVQELPVEFFVDQLGPNDIFFIDSTHTVKSGSDCLYLYLKIVPQLRPGVLVHAHDIFLPEMFSAYWQRDLGLYWMEQYLLQAYLLDNPHVKVLYGSYYHHLVNPEVLKRFMAGKFRAGGVSFWFAKV